MREKQMRMLDMLLYIQQRCERLEIPFYIDGGTLLGAVRHKGFIPWDDDLDIVVDRKYYKRLIRELISHPHPRYVLQNHQTDPGYFHGWAKLRDRFSSSVYHGDDDTIIDVEKSQHYTGLMVDVFCYSDHVIPWMNKVIHGLHRRINYRYLVGRHRILSELLWILCMDVLSPLANVLGILFSNRKTYAHDYCSNNTVHRFLKDRIYPLSPIEFEGHTFMAPHDTDYFLRTLYGNYMCVPPESARHHHDLEFTLQPYEDNHSFSGGNE